MLELYQTIYYAIGVKVEFISLHQLLDDLIQ